VRIPSIVFRHRPTDDTVGFPLDHNRRIFNLLLSSWSSDRDRAIEQELDRPNSGLSTGLRCKVHGAFGRRRSPFAGISLACAGCCFF
jgi:hypothetical protein